MSVSAMEKSAGEGGGCDERDCKITITHQPISNILQSRRKVEAVIYIKSRIPH